MIRTIARRTTVTLAMAGVAAFGAVALAPAASAAEDVDGGYSIIEFGMGNGPDAFLVTDNGRRPVFFCDPHVEKALDKVEKALDKVEKASEKSPAKAEKAVEKAVEKLEKALDKAADSKPHRNCIPDPTTGGDRF